MCSQFGSWSTSELPETPMPYNQLRCDVCDCELRVGFPRVRDPQTGHRFAIARCPECGLGHTTPQPDDLDEYYGPRSLRNRRTAVREKPSPLCDGGRKPISHARLW